jgi:integrase
MKLTKTAVERLSVPGQGYALYWDEQLPGFGVRVTQSGVKAFILQKRVKGREHRFTLGRVGVITAEKARRRAIEILGQIAGGGDPVAEQAQQKLKAVTLEQAFTDYFAARKGLKPRTQADMQAIVDTHLKDWQRKPLTSITREVIARRHKAIGARSPSRANVTMRYLRAIFNFAMAEYRTGEGVSLISQNPVMKLSEIRGWYRVERRRTVIKPHELKPWIQGVLQLESDTARDYLLLLLLTGLRKREAARLTWDKVDLEGRTLTVIDTKNHQPHILPLSDYLVEMLMRRKSEATSRYVFPGPGRDGHYVEPRGAMARVTALSGVSFSLHDLRRTFCTVGESLDVPAYALKILLSHKMNGDITAQYVVMNVERLRAPMQKITDFMLKADGIKVGAEVTEPTSMAVND